MRIGCLALFGFFLGGAVGACGGVGVGLAWTKIFATSNFEGYGGMLVFYSFMPLGALIGAVGGAVLTALAGRNN